MHSIFRGGAQHQPTLVQYGHIGAEVFNVIYDVGGEDDNAFGADIAEDVKETLAFTGVKPGSGFVYDDELGLVEQELGNAKTLFHATRIAAHVLVPHCGEIGDLEAIVNHGLPFLAGGNAL